MSDTARRADYATQRDWLAAVAPGTGLRPEYAMWVDREAFYAMERELRRLRGAVAALGFYAAQENYEWARGLPNGRIQEDRGSRARAALDPEGGQ